METILNIVANTNSVQTLILMALGCSGFVWIKSGFDRKMDRMEASLKAQIGDLRSELKGDANSLRNELRDEIGDLKHSVGALIYVLGKNGYLKTEDKEYIGSL